MVDGPDQFTEVTTDSWLSRITGAFAGIIVGFLLFVVSFPLLWWNEGNSVENIKRIDEGRNLVVAVSPERSDPANNGKLIYTTGNATTDEVLNDGILGVQVKALKLQRTAEMYQWKEKESSASQKNLGGSETTTKTYSYEKTWSAHLINSSQFKKKEGHENPATMPLQSQTFTAQNITLGAFKLSDSLVSQISNFENYALSDQTFAAMEPSLKASFKLNGAEYLYGDPVNTQIGAVRISYKIITPADVSVIGKQDGNVINSFMTKHGNIVLLSMGSVGADGMFAKAATQNTIMTWLFRFGGFLLMFIGLCMILNPLKVLADVVPFIGSVVGAGTGAISGITALALSFGTIAVAWIYYRPLMGVGLLVVAAALFFYGSRMLTEVKGKISHG